MTDYIAFMRAVNVPGHGRVTRRDIRDAFGAAGCGRIRTFIQSGNIVFESPAREVAAVLRTVTRTLRTVLNEEPVILLRTVGQIASITDAVVVERPPAGHHGGESAGWSQSSEQSSRVTRRWCDSSEHPQSCHEPEPLETAW